MKQEICKAFCDSVTVTKLPCGFGISTTLFEINGDPAGLYAIGPDRMGLWRLEDAGLLLPMLGAAGYDLSSPSRVAALNAVIGSAGASFDEEEMLIFSDLVPERDVPARAIRLLGGLVRASDLVHLTTERVRSTFKEDVRTQLASALPSDIELNDNVPVDDRFGDLRADIVLTRAGHVPVAIYLAQNDLALVEAMLLRSETTSAAARPLVGAMIERDRSVSTRTRQRAVNRLDTVAIYEGDERQAVARLAQFAQQAPKLAH